MQTITKPKHCKVKRERLHRGGSEFLLEYPTQAFKQAACIGTDLDFFFPDNEVLTKDQRLILERVCNGCPIKDICLEWALCNERYGLWANTTAEQRGRLRKKLGWVVSDNAIGWNQRYGS